MAFRRVSSSSLLYLAGAALLIARPVTAQTGLITGIVRDAATRAPITTSLGLCVQEGNWCRTLVTSDANGAYRAQVSPGVYFVYTVGNGAGRAYVDEIFPDILCPGECSPQVALQSGAPLVVTPNGSVRADFELHRGGSIAGTVTDARTAAPLAGVSVWVTLVNGNTLVGGDSAQTDPSGRYVIEGLPPGRYYARTYEPLANYLNEIYDNIPCGPFCDASDLVTGTTIAVVAGTTIDGRDFALDPGGRITGTVTDAVTTLPIGMVCVHVLTLEPPFSEAGYGCTDAGGAYEVRGLSPDSYLLMAVPSGANYVQQLYQLISCPAGSCNLTSGTPVAASSGGTTGGINFALDAGATIRGTVRDAATGQASVTGSVVVYSRDGAVLRMAGQGTVQFGAGEYLVAGLPAGTYYAYTSLAGYHNEIFGDVRCQAEFCTEQELATLGTPITLVSGGSTTGIDFAVRNDLVPGPPQPVTAFVNGTTVTLSWGEPLSGGKPSGYILDAGATPGATFVQAGTAANQFAVGGVPPGRYFLRVRAVNANGIGPASDDILVTVASAGSPPASAPMNLKGWMAGPRLTLTWAAPPFAPDVTGYVVQAGSATGVTDIACIGVNARALSYIPVPPGYYFVRVRAMNANGLGPASNEVLVNAGDVAAPPAPPLSLTSRVSGATVTLEWTPPFGEPPAGYVLRAGSAPGLSNLAEAITTDTTLSFSGVPVGVYYVRVHAVDALGLGPASAEVTVIVR